MVYATQSLETQMQEQIAADTLEKAARERILQVQNDLKANADTATSVAPASKKYFIRVVRNNKAQVRSVQYRANLMLADAQGNMIPQSGMRTVYGRSEFSVRTILSIHSYLREAKPKNPYAISLLEAAIFKVLPFRLAVYLTTDSVAD